MSYSLVVPALALGSLGGVVVSAVGSGVAQNVVAKKLHPEIPSNAKPYPNFVNRNRTHAFTNNTRLGWLAFLTVFGASFVGARVAVQPLFNLVRKQYIFLPGTKVPRRINSFVGLVYDILPDVMVWTAPLIPAFPLAMVAKVAVDGPGRFKNWNESYNPYDKYVQSFEQLYNRPEKPVRPLIIGNQNAH